MLEVLCERFGLDPSLCVLEDSSVAGTPKSFLETPDGPLFIGSLAPSWPETAHLEWLMTTLNSHTELPIGRYRPGSDGSFIQEAMGVRRFARAALRGGPPDESELIRSIAEAAARLHVAIPQVPPSHCRSVAAEIQEVLIPALGPNEALRSVRADQIDLLPRSLVHNDLQPKNLLVDAAEVRIIDLEHACGRPRAFDLYFLLVTDDLGEVDHRRLADGLAIYESMAGPLSGAERALLPDVFIVKAASIAAWALSVERKDVREQALATMEEVVLWRQGT